MYSIPDNDKLVIEEIALTSGGLRLHGELVYAGAGGAAGSAVIAGPHPLLDGHMHNNVVRGLSEALARRGLPVVRFDYRGVPELWHDVQAAADLARQAADGGPLVLVGYDSGCALLPRVQAAGPLVQILVAPSLSSHDADAFLSLRRPTLVIAAPDDFAADAARLRGWFARLPAPKQLVLRPGDGYFFRGQEEWLAATAWAFLQEVPEVVS